MLKWTFVRAASLGGVVGLLLGAETFREPERPAGELAVASRTNPGEESALGTTLPPAPEGVTDLRLNQLFVHPVGPLGLEYSPEARALVGEKVRLTGYMVRQTQPVPWAFLLSPRPLMLHESEYGLAEDLPASAVHVRVPRHLPPVLPHVRGLLSVVGRLELGNQAEANGRISTVRLQIETPPIGTPLPIRCWTHSGPPTATLASPARVGGDNTLTNRSVRNSLNP